MAAVEDSSNPPAPAPISFLPEYPELILAAIEALDSKKGACKSRISKHIEELHGSVPAAHKTLLSHHLNKMTASGELIVINNNYVKADPNSPGRPRRGRPSKPKPPLPEGAVVSPPRSRGRPKKSPGSLAVVVVPEGELPEVASPATLSGQKRGRGRPPMFGGSPSASRTPKSSGGGKGRGRPRKVVAGGEATPTPSTGKQKSRGRPRKAVVGGDATSTPATGEKRSRGRPPKIVPTGYPTGKRAVADATATPAAADVTETPVAAAYVTATPAVDTAVTPSTGGSKGRGRPRKYPKVDGGATPAPSTGEKRGRGRPRKVVETEAPVGSD